MRQIGRFCDGALNRRVNHYRERAQIFQLRMRGGQRGSVRRARAYACRPGVQSFPRRRAPSKAKFLAPGAKIPPTKPRRLLLRHLEDRNDQAENAENCHYQTECYVFYLTAPGHLCRKGKNNKTPQTRKSLPRTDQTRERSFPHPDDHVACADGAGRYKC